MCRQRQTRSKTPSAPGPAVTAQLKAQTSSSGIWDLLHSPQLGSAVRLSGHWEVYPAMNLGEYTPGEAGSCLGTSTEGPGRSQSQVRAQVGCVCHPCVLAWHMRLIAATQLGEQHRAAQPCDSKAGIATMGFETSLKYKLLHSARAAQVKHQCCHQPVRHHLRNYN